MTEQYKTREEKLRELDEREAQLKRDIDRTSGGGSVADKLLYGLRIVSGPGATAGLRNVQGEERRRIEAERKKLEEGR
jgi:hypothetical protein